MNLRRARTIALSQLRALKERLDQIDSEYFEDRLSGLLARQQAEAELAEALGRSSSPQMSPPSGSLSEAMAKSEPQPTPQSPLARWYRILSVREGASLAEVEVAYHKLMEKLNRLEIQAGEEQQDFVRKVRERVQEAYNALRKELSPLAPRFDNIGD